MCVATVICLNKILETLHLHSEPITFPWFVGRGWLHNCCAPSVADPGFPDPHICSMDLNGELLLRELTVMSIGNYVSHVSIRQRTRSARADRPRVRIMARHSKLASWTCNPILPVKKVLPLHLRVETLLGDSFNVKVMEGESVYGLKAMISDRLGISPTHQRLLLRGVPINDDMSLRDYNLEKNPTILMVRRSKTYEVRVKNCDNERCKVNHS